MQEQNNISRSHLYPQLPPVPSAPPNTLQYRDGKYSPRMEYNCANQKPFIPYHQEIGCSNIPNIGNSMVLHSYCTHFPSAAGENVPPQQYRSNTASTSIQCIPVHQHKHFTPYETAPYSNYNFEKGMSYNQSGLRKGYHWVQSNTSRGVPRSAVRGGTDQDGTEIYVGRAFHQGDWCPAKVIPAKQIAYIPYGGDEHTKHEYEVLCEQKFKWVSYHSGTIPADAVEGGRTCDGEILYIGRVYHDNSHTVGKVHPSHDCLYIPFGGRELKFHNFDILIVE